MCGVQSEYVAFSLDPTLSFGKPKRPLIKWVPVASRVIASLAWIMCIENKFTFKLGIKETLFKDTRTSSVL